MSEEPRQNKGRGLVDRKVVEIAHPALLFWFFSGFRRGLWLFIIRLVRYKNRINVDR